MNKYIRYPGKTNDFSNPLYDKEYKKSLDKNGTTFWKQQAKDLDWFK